MVFFQKNTYFFVRVLALKTRIINARIKSGEARYDWKHGIAARKYDDYECIKIPRKRRLSITFRKVKLFN